MAEILIQSKITTPRLHDKIVHRERLTALLDKNINKNLIIICAPAGFGKTTLVLDYLSLHKNNYSWFSIPQKGIEDPSTFFEYIVGAFQRLNNVFGTSTLDVKKQFSSNPKMTKELIYACTTSFVNEFQKCFKDDIILIIEDLHYVDTEKSLKWFKEFFKELLDNIPPNLHLMLSTRVLPEITLTNLKAKRNALIISENDLNFTEDETTVLLDEVYKYKYDVKDIKLLDENLKGWITGLHLILQAYGEDFDKVKYRGKLNKEIIYDFFAQEIFDNLSPELQEFLMVTSLMESFDEVLANAVLGIKNSKELTDELIHKNLFIHKVQSFVNDKITYVYHALFRNFLNKRLEKSRITEEIRKLKEKIGDSYSNSGNQIDAMDYYMEAGSVDKAIPIMTKLWFGLFYLGKSDILKRWASLIPESVLSVCAPLLYRFGHLSFYIYCDDARTSYLINKALELFDFSTDQTSYINCCRIKFFLLKKQGKKIEAIQEFESLLKHDLEPRNRFLVLGNLSETYGTIGEFEKAIELFKEALRISENIGDDQLRYDIYQKIANTYSDMGNYNQSIYYYKMLLEKDKMICSSIANNANLAVSYYFLGDYSSSIKYMDAAFNLLKNHNSPKMWVAISSQKAEILRQIGEIEESTIILEEISQHAEKIVDCSDVFHILYGLLNNYCLLDDYNKSIESLKIIKQYSEKFNTEYYEKASSLCEGIHSVNFSVDNSIESTILAAYDYFKSINNKEFKLISVKYLSIYYLTAGDYESALKNLTTFLKEASMSANDLISSRNFIDFSLSRPELTQYKDKVHNAFTQFFDRLNIVGTSDEYKRKMKLEIEKLYDINMKSFGILEFMYRGEQVAESKWRKKKGKSILAFIMLNPKVKYNKDKLIEMFFPDAKPNTVEDNFRQAVFNIRSTFKNQYLNFLIMEGKMLYLNPDCYFKSDAEEFNKNCKIARSAERSKEEKIKACKEAIELYKGEFLEGNYEQWCEDIRSDFHNKFISISEILLDLLNNENNNEDKVYYAEKLLRHDKLNEKAYLSLVESSIDSGKINAAKETYSKMLKIFEEELSEKPEGNILTKINNMLDKKITTL